MAYFKEVATTSSDPTPGGRYLMHKVTTRSGQICLVFVPDLSIHPLLWMTDLKNVPVTPHIASSDARVHAFRSLEIASCLQVKL